MKYVYSFLVLSPLLFLSCSKWLPENRIVGTWKLVDAEKIRVFDKDPINTGYESGVFTFNNDETASYSDAGGQLDGNWRIRLEYAGEDNNQHSFSIRLYDPTSNRTLDWYFDRIDFRRSGDRLFAFIDKFGYYYRYEFQRQ